MDTQETSPRRMRGFNVKFKSETRGCGELHYLAHNSAEALQYALNEFGCCLKKESAFSVFVTAGRDPDVLRYQRLNEVRHGTT